MATYLIHWEFAETRINGQHGGIERIEANNPLEAEGKAAKQIRMNYSLAWGEQFTITRVEPVQKH
jgi:hypothetical protein